MSRKIKDARYESKTPFRPLTVRVHDKRRKKVEDYAKTKICPDYERELRMKEDERKLLKDKLGCSEYEITLLQENFEIIRRRNFFSMLLIFLLLALVASHYKIQ